MDDGSTGARRAMADLRKKLCVVNPNGIKGEAGTILIIGGSGLYTGAPYFAAMASFYSGAELVYIFAQPEAVIPLKTLAPECIICEMEKQEWILKRITACVVGPGLGRPSSDVLERIRETLLFLDERCVPLVVDGDAITLGEELGVYRLRNAILTPNANERKRMPGCALFCVEKGPRDLIRCGGLSCSVTEEGCPKRVAGQGDILSGVIASMAARLGGLFVEEEIFALLKLACRIVRSAARSAYRRRWNSMSIRDVLDELPAAFKCKVHE
jgi:ATP-dependent NAD(P)H-hydrate dehydratase